ncbi:hypothetical protein [Devosia sp.]|nr:hypothetical protein [Devosia sp.]MBE0579965.1 hypothetical protein [Devosia sp.]
MPDAPMPYMNMHLSHCGQAKRLKLAKEHGTKVERDLEAMPWSTAK